jgi:hypothetical protein
MQDASTAAAAAAAGDSSDGTGVGKVMAICGGCSKDFAVSLLATTEPPGDVEQAVGLFYSAGDIERDAKEAVKKEEQKANRKRPRFSSGPGGVNTAGRVPPAPRRSTRPDCGQSTRDVLWHGWILKSSNYWDVQFEAGRGPPVRIAGVYRAGAPEWRGGAAVLQHLREGEVARRWKPSQIQAQAERADLSTETGAVVSQNTRTEFETIEALQSAHDAAYIQVFYGKEVATQVLHSLGANSGFIPHCAQLKRMEKSLIVFISKLNSFSGTHRDSTPSILHCTWGTKTIWLAPPNLHERWPELFKAVPNHPDFLSYDPFQDRADDEPRPRGIPGPPAHGWQRCTLLPGESLFIPAKWWHNVFSPAGTVGLSADITAVQTAAAVGTSDGGGGAANVA